MLPALFSKKDSSESYIFEASPEIVLFLDIRGRILKINDRVYDWLKIKPKELVGKSVFDLNLLTPQSKELVKTNFAKRIRGLKVKPYDIECFARDGHIEHGRVTATLTKKAGFPTGILVMISNVTQLEKELQIKLEAVRTSEVRYKGLFDNIDDAVVICEYNVDKKQFFITEVNNAFRRIEQCNKKDVLGKRLQTIFPHVSQGDICESITEAWKEDRRIDFELSIKRNREELFRKGNVYRLPTDELVVLYEDTTKEVKAERDIQENEKKYRLLFETANDAIFLMDGKTFVDCNDKTLEIFSCSKKSEVVGKNPLDFSPEKQPDGQTSKRKALKYIRLALHGRPQRFYWKHLKKDGQEFDAEVTLNSVKVSTEIILQAIVRDITKERNIVALLQDSEQKFRTIIENAQAIIFILNKDGEFILTEGKKLSVLGIKPKELIGQNITQLYRDYPQIKKGVEKALKGKTTRKTILINDIYFDIFFSPYIGEDKSTIGVIGMAIDVTDSELAKAHLLEMDAAKSEFISMASHQLRSPLSSMRWELETLLSKQANGPEETHLALKNVYKNNLRLIDLVNKLLNISRIENKKTMDKPTKIDVVAMVNSILKDSTEKIEEAELEVLVMAPSQLTVQYDENILREVLSNLIVNAIKFNKRRGIIIIELEKDSGKWTFHIANTGKPISKTDSDHLFEKFFRGSNASGETPGTGLGLYITHQYVSKWNGVVTFTSPARFGEKSIRGTKNSGTVFKVELPVSSQ